MAERTTNIGRALLPLAFLLAGWLSAHPAQAEGNPFPAYACIQANIAFWKKIYSQYSSSQGVIHDNVNLAIVYEVVELVDPREPGAALYNTPKIREAKDKYIRILSKLANGEEASEREEQRVAALFGPTPDPRTLEAASRNVRYQSGISDRFREGVVRSGLYLAEMKEIFRSYQLPDDLAYLPHVESSFNYAAYSKTGAAGIWQFMPATGRRFLTINNLIDERRDPIRATHAAAQFLKGNHARLESWPLALTAYNHGTSGMVKAQREHGGYERIFSSYESPSFGFASRNFYAEFMAAREVAQNCGEYFPNLRLAEPVATHEVEVPPATTLPAVAARVGVGVEALRELNPALQEPICEGRQCLPKGYRLRLRQNQKIGPAPAAKISAPVRPALAKKASPGKATQAPLAHGKSAVKKKVASKPLPPKHAAPKVAKKKTVPPGRKQVAARSGKPPAANAAD